MILKYFQRNTKRKCWCTLLKCDTCGIEFERLHKRSGTIHFHNKSCKRKAYEKGGAIRSQIEKTNLKSYGVVTPLMNHLNRCWSPAARKKRASTCLKKYGADNPWKSQRIRKKLQRTCKKRYGWSTPFQSDTIHDKAISGACSTLAQIRRKQTCYDRYGVCCTLLLPIAKCRAHDKATEEARHNTLKQKGFYNKQSSKFQIALHEILCQEFGDENIKQDVRLCPERRWTVDFYIANIDTYVQYDGRYWHGLDRDINEIAKHKTARDKKIHEKWLTDREVDDWVVLNNKRLIRLIEGECDVSDIIDTIKKDT